MTAVVVPPQGVRDDVVLRDDVAEVVFDGRCGGVRVLRDRQDGIRLRADEAPSLFVLEVPRHGDRTVVVATERQRLTAAEPAVDGRSVTLRWDGVVTSSGEALPLRITVDAGLDGRGRLTVALDAQVGDVEVEAVRFPSLRGFRAGPGGRLLLHRTDYSQGTVTGLLPEFAANDPYWGTLVPDHASSVLRPESVGNPTSPFVVLDADPGGTSVLPSVPTQAFVGWRLSLEPGFADSLVRTPRALDDSPAVTLDAVQFPVPVQDGAGTVLRPEPFTVALHRGPWQEGLRAYRDVQRPARVAPAAWLSRPHAWSQVQLRSTEGETRYDFDDLVGIVEECAALGIGALQVVGWNEGGQDGLVPVHRPAAGLGGEAGLRRVLDRARDLDVAAVLYVKYQWVEDPGPSWERFERHVCRDANGRPYAQPGPVYHSARKRYGVNTPSYVPLCFSSPDLRAEFAAEVGQLARWGASGVLADESLYHGRALLCFATDHDHAPGASAFTWDGEFADALRAAGTAERADFVVVGEGCYDAQFEHYDATYFRSASERHVPLGRTLRPRGRFVTAATGFDDRGMVHQSLLHAYAVSLEPFHFKGRPRDAPATVAYCRAVDDVRRALAPWLWNGAPLGDRSVVDGDGSSHRLGATAWRAGGGSVCVAVVNDAEHPRAVRVDVADVEDPVVVPVVVPGSDEGARWSEGTVVLPARGAAVVVGRSDAVGAGILGPGGSPAS